MPNMDLTIEEARIVRWTKTIGQAVRAGEVILEVETDKAVVDVEAPADGLLAKIVANEGDVIPLGRPVGFIQPNQERRM
jgi:pyruvate dehydrogenase E2 component (dihydrolipoamide acetyltransferase)